MARPRAFDVDAALAATMACFRHHGYQATSIRDLESATGVKAASLYAAFGNKEAMYAAALDRYCELVVRRRIRDHLAPDAGLEGIREFFSTTYTNEPRPEHGCMVATGAVEADDLEPSARQAVEGALREMRDAFRDVLDRAAAPGEVATSLDRDVAADLLLVLYQGQLGLMRGRTTPPPFDFDAAIALTIHQFATHQPTKETDR